MSQQPKPTKKTDPALAQPSGSDERNLMEADSPSSLAPEEQVMYFLEKYKWLIIAILLGGSIAFFYQYFGGWWSDRQAQALAATDAAAVTTEEKIAFAAQNPRSPLAGVALMEAARAQFEAGGFGESASTYRQAARALEGNPLGFRAQIAVGVSLARDDRGAEALSYLQALILQSGIPASLQAEAAFYAAVIAHTLGNSALFQEMNAVLDVNEFGLVWSNRLQPFRSVALGELVPEDSLPSISQPSINFEEMGIDPSQFIIEDAPVEQIPASIARPGSTGE
jgi:hypothetical protein